MNNQDILKAQAIAKNIEEYLRKNRLHYGQFPRENGDASWTLALHNHFMTAEQEKTLRIDFSDLIYAFHSISFYLMRGAFSIDTDRSYKKLHKYLTVGVPEETQKLWQQVAFSEQSVFSSRPDMVCDIQGKFHIVEYNTDGGADKGNTQGVNDYSKLFLTGSILGENLSKVFVQEVRKRFKDKSHLIVATVLPDNYRSEYDSQNAYFAIQANTYGQDLDIEWIVVHMSEISINDNNVTAMIRGKMHIIDVIDREFKLPGFVPNVSFEKERALLQAVLDKKVSLLGSILPFQDKILLSTLFSEEYVTLFPDHVIQKLRSIHAETAILDLEEKKLCLKDTKFTLDELFNLKLGFDLVLKRSGDTIGSTGSKGLIISQDVNLETWKLELEKALKEPQNGGSYWVIQKFYPSTRFPVKHIKNSRSLPKELQVINRVAPYYVSSGSQMRLGNVLVTAGTDEETYKRKRNNVHGLRQNTYQAVSVLG